MSLVVLESSVQVMDWCICGKCLEDPNSVLYIISKVCCCMPLSLICSGHFALTTNAEAVAIALTSNFVFIAAQELSMVIVMEMYLQLTC